MPCSHSSSCPMFPYLNGSIVEWRRAYCDSSSGWNSCARYQLSLRGEPVPVALLPNGRLPVLMVPDVNEADLLIEMPPFADAEPAPEWPAAQPSPTGPRHAAWSHDVPPPVEPAEIYQAQVDPPYAGPAYAAPTPAGPVYAAPSYGIVVPPKQQFPEPPSRNAAPQRLSTASTAAGAPPSLSSLLGQWWRQRRRRSPTGESRWQRMRVWLSVPT